MHALERVLAQRQEILAALQPVPPLVVRGWAPDEDGGAVRVEAEERTAKGGVMGAGVNLFGVDNELGMSGESARVQAARQQGEADRGGGQMQGACLDGVTMPARACPLPLAPCPCPMPADLSIPPLQALAGPSSPARLPPRCWRATPTITTGATWWPRCWRQRGSPRAGAWWWHSGAPVPAVGAGPDCASQQWQAVRLRCAGATPHPPVLAHQPACSPAALPCPAAPTSSPARW